MGIVSDVDAAFMLPMISHKNVQINENEGTDNSDVVKHDLKHLEFEERKIVPKMLYEERKTFFSE